mgnify:CR=1 FL=1
MPTEHQTENILLDKQRIHIQLVLDHAGLIHEVSSLLETFFVGVGDLCGEIVVAVHLFYSVHVEVKSCGNSLHGLVLAVSHVGCDLVLCSI